MEEYKKINIFDQIAIAVSSSREYKFLVELKTHRIIMFMFVFTFLLSFMQTGIEMIFWTQSVGGFYNLATNEMPAFTYKDKELIFEHEYQMDIGNLTVLFNSEDDAVKPEALDVDGSYMTVGKKTIVFYIVTDQQVYKYNEMPLAAFMLPEGFNNETLAKFSPAIYLYEVMIFLMDMFGKTLKMLVLAFVISFMANGLNMGMQVGLSYGKVFTIALYAQAFGMLLTSANAALSYPIPGFIIWIVFFISALGFANKGVLSCRASGNKPDDWV